jgi:polar amino acid transport system substrate-binding protein
MRPAPRMSATRRMAMLGGAALGGTALLGRAANADTLADIRARGVLVAATEMQFPPFDFLENGVYRGVDHDLVREVSNALGVKLQIIDLPWTQILPALDARKFDLVIAPVTVTLERMRRYAFTVPVADATAALMKHAGNAAITAPTDLAGRIVGGQRGTAQLDQFRAFAATLATPATVQEFEDNNQAYAALAAGHIDAAVNSLPNLAYAAQQRPEVFRLVRPPFGQPSYFSWVARQDDQTLVEAVSAVLVRLDQDGRMEAVQKKWLDTVVKLPITVPQPGV